MQALGNYLIQLKNFSENILTTDALSLIKDIKNICFHEVSDNELGIFY